jgi:hypothetical protein
MPTISVFYGITILMYWNDHAPPHFHAMYQGFEAVIDIRSLQLTRGSMPNRALALVVEWASTRQAELLEDWDLCMQKQSPKPIDPLQ